MEYIFELRLTVISTDGEGVPQGHLYDSPGSEWCHCKRFMMISLSFSDFLNLIAHDSFKIFSFFIEKTDLCSQSD